MSSINTLNNISGKIFPFNTNYTKTKIICLVKKNIFEEGRRRPSICCITKLIFCLYVLNPNLYISELFGKLILSTNSGCYWDPIEARAPYGGSTKAGTLSTNLYVAVYCKGHLPSANLRQWEKVLPVLLHSFCCQIVQTQDLHFP